MISSGNLNFLYCKIQLFLILIIHAYVTCFRDTSTLPVIPASLSGDTVLEDTPTHLSFPNASIGNLSPSLFHKYQDHTTLHNPDSRLRGNDNFDGHFHSLVISASLRDNDNFRGILSPICHSCMFQAGISILYISMDIKIIQLLTI